MDYKKQFIKFMYESNVLKFGDFVTKSGRNTPYFINTGNYNTGEQISKLGEFYAKCIKENKLTADVVFGPAYKGIALSVAVSMTLFKDYGENISYCFNRKEAKEHGERGTIIGHSLKDNEKVLIIEDVITAGTALREVVPIIKNQANVNIEGVIISVDRMEKSKGSMSAIDTIYEELGIKVYSIVNIQDIIDCINEEIISGKEYLEKILEYRNTYGINL